MQEYTKTSKTIHWLTAIIVLSMLTFSFFLSDLPSSIKPNAYMLHKSFGLTVLGLMLLRIIWIISAGRPSLPSNMPNWERIFARAVQHSFYLFLILMPLSGWIMATASKRSPVFFGLITIPCPGISPNQDLAKLMNSSHKIIAWILITLAFFHICGALKHHFLDKDEVLKKML